MRRFSLLITLAMINCQSPAAEEQKTAAAKTAAVPVQTANPTTAEVDKTTLMGKFTPADHPDFVLVGSPYSAKAGMYLHKETFDAFKKMYDAAKKDGVVLNIISSTRNFDQQKKIWEDKWSRFAKEAPDETKRALKILEYSSMPGTSRHHWGTDIDLNDLNNPSFEGSGKYRKVYEWLEKNAATYGFGQPYTPKGDARPNGYNEEKWHWSYLPIAKKYRAAYLQSIQNEDIGGFKGSGTAVSLNVVKNYVGGVSAACQ